MRDSIIKFLFLAKVEFIAPLSGASVSFLAWCVKLAPLFSIIAAVVGVIIGVLSYRIKKKQSDLDAEQKRVEIDLKKAELARLKETV